MELISINIYNFRSIYDLEFNIEEINNSKTYSFLGINESGKSNFLKAISLFDDDVIEYPSDYFDDTDFVRIGFKYSISQRDLKEFRSHLEKEYTFPREITNMIKSTEVILYKIFDPGVNSKPILSERIILEDNLFDNYTLQENIPTKKVEDENESFDLVNFLSGKGSRFFYDRSHVVKFWEASPKYLTVDDIDLVKFAEDPKNISLPILNCFKHANIGQKQIKQEIEKLNNPVSIQNLMDKLSDSVTKHINTVWPEHKIKIRFQTHNNQISLLVEDVGVDYKVKRTSQRSEGFRQFVSFLLTSSIESKNQILSNTILLIDEPETHLHPKAQINLLNELIKITSNNRNNIVLFATHSNYMIDKIHMDRCYRVIKKENEKTEIKHIVKSFTSYSEVNYDIFEIPTNDYHNELYGYLMACNEDGLKKIPENKKWYNDKLEKEEDVSLPKYIRNSIHHPENSSNKSFSEHELNKSIKLMRDIKYN